MVAFKKNEVPVFDGFPQNFDKREIQWGFFAEVEGLSSALGH